MLSYVGNILLQGLEWAINSGMEATSKIPTPMWVVIYFLTGCLLWAGMEWILEGLLSQAKKEGRFTVGTVFMLVIFAGMPFLFAIFAIDSAERMARVSAQMAVLLGYLSLPVRWRALWCPQKSQHEDEDEIVGASFRRHLSH